MKEEQILQFSTINVKYKIYHNFFYIFQKSEYFEPNIIHFFILRYRKSLIKIPTKFIEKNVKNSTTRN